MTQLTVRLAPNRLGGATFSPCETYRYDLWRRWDHGQEVAFVGLNPSVATELRSDPTVTRCIKYAQRWGFAGMHMLNLFGLRSTDPKALYGPIDPIGPDNDWIIKDVCGKADTVIVAWGVHGALNRRDLTVLGVLEHLPLWCLGTTKGGYPRHPLYLPKDVQRQAYA
jgi:hypothetical protein